MTDYQLRDYQEAAIDQVQVEYARGNKQALLCMPTGAGKTLTAAEMLGRSYRKGKTMLWLTDRAELAEQASEAFNRAGVPHSYIMAGQHADRFGRAFVGTIQSFLAWRKQDEDGQRRRWTPDRVDFVIIDEAHRTQSKSFQDMLAEYPNAFVLGLTATPMRGDNQGLGQTYKSLIVPITMRELLDRGVLVPARYFIPSAADYATLQRLKSGDYSAAELSQWADANPQLVGDVVENFARVCPERRFVAFPPDIKTSVALRDRFNAAGFSCAHVDGMHTPTAERRAILEAFRKGEIQGLTSVNIAVEGLDVPDVSAVIFARPTKSERIWVQGVGRGLRSSAGKTDCVVLDHGGVLMQFGPAEEFVPPELHSKKGKKNEGEERKKRTPTQYRCEGEDAEGRECGAVLIATNICPECGHVHQFEAIPAHETVIPGQLEELTTEGREKHMYDLELKKRWYAMFLGYCHNRGKNPGLAYHLHLAKFGEKPLWAWRDTLSPLAPDAEVLAFCKYRQIAYARSQQKRSAA